MSIVDPLDLLDTSFALAYRQAEDDVATRHAEEDALELARRTAEVILHVYDPMAPPIDVRMYEGTGIGALYGFADTERFLPELGDWRVAGVTA